MLTGFVFFTLHLVVLEHPVAINEIATRAIEMYKGQYGTEGLSGLMFASVDENKFKQEVAKLLEPAINDITTKMDEKFKEIQNAVGGITKTA